MTSMMTAKTTGALALTMLASACVITLEPVGDDDVGDTETDTNTTTDTNESSSSTDESSSSTDESSSSTDESSTGDGDGDTTTTSETDTTTGGGDCSDPTWSEFFGVSIQLGGEPIGANLDLDLGCTIIDDGTTVLQLDCPQFDLAITFEGELVGEIPDIAGQSVAVRLITDDTWFLGETWLRLDFIGESRSVFVIDARTLAPIDPTTWVPPWGIAVVDECAAIDDGCGEWVGQTLGVTWEDQALELLHGEFGSLGDNAISVWNEQSWRYQTIGPACDTVGEWKKVAISSANLVESEVCTPGETDPCGTGLECCYPCGIPDCDFVCTPEDPETMGCPPPPP